MSKPLLIKIHLYCGLFTVFYLIAFGVSSIILNHNFQVDKTEITKENSHFVKIDPALSDNELARSIKNQLDLMGWELPWKFQRDSASLHFQVTHPGRNYFIDANLESGQVLVGEAPKGFIAVLHGLHFFNGNIPNAPAFIRTWAVYQWLTLFTMLVSLILGLWLWINYNYQQWEGIVFGGVFLVTILIMFLI